MRRIPSKAAIAAEEHRLLERQRAFRAAADPIASTLAECRDVEAIALIGSVPVRYGSRCHASRLTGNCVFRSRMNARMSILPYGSPVPTCVRRVAARLGKSSPNKGHGPAVQQVEVFLLEPDTNRYRGRGGIMALAADIPSTIPDTDR